MADGAIFMVSFMLIVWSFVVVLCVCAVLLMRMRVSLDRCHHSSQFYYSNYLLPRSDTNPYPEHALELAAGANKVRISIYSLS